MIPVTDHHFITISIQYNEILCTNCKHALSIILQLTRYRIYVACMTSTSIEELQTRYIPSSLVPSPSVSTLATMQIDEMTFKSDPPSPTLSTQSHLALDIKHRRKGLFHRK